MTDNYNQNKFINSNIYYFEFEIDLLPFRESFENENLKIGFISCIFGKDEVVFGDSFSYGLDLNENSIKMNSVSYEIPSKILKGDTVGLGLEYYGNNYYRLILTINGIEIGFEEDQGIIKNCYPLKLGMNFNLSHGLRFNFGDKKFKFNLERIISSSTIHSICDTTYLKLGFSDSLIDTNKNFCNNKGKNFLNWKTKKFSKQKISNPIFFQTEINNEENTHL